MDILLAGIRSAAEVVRFGIDNPTLIWVVAALLLCVYVVRAIRRHMPVQTDQQRTFTQTQRNEAKRRAGGRCEHSYLGLRCRAAGAHADHIYPWSRGGATRMSNAQSLCAAHNLRKSARIPSRFYIHRLQKRRAKYFPSGEEARVEWHLGASR